MIMKNSFTRKEGKRIAYYRLNSPVKADMWDDHWSTNASPDLKDFYRRYLRGYLGYGQIRYVLLKHLPRFGLIVEGGCGMGQYVVALRARGYNCIGVDFAAKTVAAVKKVLPDIPVEAADICRLNLDDESVDAYISLGVVEHFQDGPQDALAEALRVLKKGGVLIVSVPQVFNWRGGGVCSEDASLPDNASFYQYAFSQEDFRMVLVNLGFCIEAEYGISLLYAFRCRFKLFRKLWAIFPSLAKIDILVDRIPIGSNFARMRLYVARKK
jgi:SAM-dependent methyltransferase